MNGTNEPTKNLTDDLSDRQLLLLVLERVTGIEERVTRLEVAEEERKRETRPLWERLNTQINHLNEQVAHLNEQVARLSDQTVQVFARLSAIEDEQRRMRYDIISFSEDLRNERRERFYLAERLTALERQIAPPN